MNAFRSSYLRLDLLQRKLWFRVAATIIALIGCGILFGSLILTSNDLDVQRRALVSALSGQNINDRDETALALLESGTVVANGRMYVNERVINQPGLLFDQDGTIARPAALAESLLQSQYPEHAPRWLLEQPGTTWLLALLTTGWLILIIWMQITLPFLLTLIGTAIPVTIAALLEKEQAVWAFAGIGILTFTFVLLTRLALVLYQRPNQVLSLAHTVIKEASRTRISLVFIVIILVLLPLLPFGLDPDSPLRFRIQTFISRSLGFTFYIAACMTLFLSCATVAFEIRDRQIWQLMTKPVTRLNYLIGKWLGVITINLIILLIAGVSIFTFIQYLREQPVAPGQKGLEDAQQVRDAVLTARVGARPTYFTPTSEQVRARVDQYIEQDAELRALDEVPLAVRRELQQKVEQAFSISQRTVPPQGVREYIFENLEPVRRLQATLTLRYRFHILRDDEHKTFPAAFMFNNDQNLVLERTYVPTVTHVLSIPSELVREDGTLLVAIANMHQPPPETPSLGSLNFEMDDFELLYKVDSFEANFLAILVDWVKLAFLAMLGICCATFLSFPVACLMSFTVFVAGTIGPFLAKSLEEYYPVPMAAVDWGNIGVVIQWAFQSAIRSIAQVIVFLLDSFGEFRPAQLLVEGRLIRWSSVGMSVIKLGFVWSGLALLIGYIALRKRQLAIYSGHG